MKASNLRKLVRETIKQTLGEFYSSVIKPNRRRKQYHYEENVTARLVHEEMLSLLEDTTLRSIVVKAPDEAAAEAAVGKLKAKGIQARSQYPTKMDPFSKTEKEGWAVLVEPKDVKRAADALKSSGKGLTFDPYSHTSGK